MNDNPEILLRRTARFNSHPGPRVGDYILMSTARQGFPGGWYTRITHIWDNEKRAQTGGMHGRYYLNESGRLEYSGGLDEGVLISDLVETSECKLGWVWFFDHGIARAYAAISWKIECRVFALKPGANIAGLYELGDFRMG